MSNPSTPNPTPSDVQQTPPKTPLPAVTTPKTAPTSPREPVPSWRFLIAMLFQSALIVAVPFKSAVTYANGQTVTLQTAPVDPYDLLRGYSQTLGFEISDKEQLKQLPGAEAVFTSENYESPAQFYVTLAAPTGERNPSNPPEAWEPVAVSLDYPEALAANQVALQGEASRWRINYGLETYYMPESQRNDINNKISEVQRSEDQAFVVDVKVDGNGNSVPLSLWVRDQEFRF